MLAVAGWAAVTRFACSTNGLIDEEKGRRNKPIPNSNGREA